MITTAPYILLANLLILIVLPVWITKRWVRAKDKQRTEWIAGVSHDIRTPLSIVMGNAEKGGVIEKQCFRIRDLIGNLNTENKLTVGTGKWDETSIHLAALVREVVCDYANLSEGQYMFRFEIAPESEETVIRADESLIRRMIDNLISNALRHNEDQCEMEVEILMQKVSRDKTKLRIADHGKGVTQEKLKKLNGRLKNEYLPEHGLGIRVVKQIAKRYHYKVTFQSVLGSGFQCDIVFHNGEK
jgi:signal transduction histidine kinase